MSLASFKIASLLLLQQNKVGKAMWGWKKCWSLCKWRPH
jgi:hypothetical protein